MIAFAIGKIMNTEIKKIESKYSLALRLSSKSKTEIILWFISWQLNNPNKKVVINKKRMERLLGH